MVSSTENDLIVLFDSQMEPWQVQLLQDRKDHGVFAMKVYTVLPNAQKLQPHHPDAENWSYMPSAFSVVGITEAAKDVKPKNNETKPNFIW